MILAQIQFTLYKLNNSSSYLVGTSYDMCELNSMFFTGRFYGAKWLAKKAQLCFALPALCFNTDPVNNITGFPVG